MGRHLVEGCCLCTGDVLSPTEFHKWCASQRKDHSINQEEVVQDPPKDVRPKLVFGQRPDVKPKAKRKKQV